MAIPVRRAGMWVTEGTILRIERFAIHDGPGIRTTVFLKGCPLRCDWCHSPESQAMAPEFMPRPERCVRCGGCTEACPQHAIQPAADSLVVAPDTCDTCGSCADACPTGARELVGRTMSVDDLMAAIEQDEIFYDESGGGVTFSGGEPMLQPAFLLAMAQACRAAQIHVAVETCGLGNAAMLLEVARSTNLFLFDLKIMDDEKHRLFTGASNAPILANLERLVAAHGNIIIRFPLIPGVNDDEENLRTMGAYLASLRLTRVDVLPYHRAGLAKYERLHRPYPMAGTEPPSRDAQDRVVGVLEHYGLIVRPGGTS